MITAVYCGVTGYKTAIYRLNVTLISEIEVNYTLLTTTRQETTTQFYNEPTSTSQVGLKIFLRMVLPLLSATFVMFPMSRGRFEGYIILTGAFN